MYKLSIDPFEIVAQRALGQEVRTTPALAYGNIYVGTDTGHTFWQLEDQLLFPRSSFDSDPTNYFVGSAAVTNTGDGPGILYVGNDNGTFYARDAAGIATGVAEYSPEPLGMIRSSPALAYIADESAHLDRWVFYTNRRGTLRAFKTDR